MKKVTEYFEEVETTKEYDEYYYQVSEVISIVVLGSLCELKNMKQVHHQKKTAKSVVDGKGDYLLSVKGNHAGLEADIADYVQDDSLRKSMDTVTQKEKNRGRLETRTAFTTDDIA